MTTLPRPAVAPPAPYVFPLPARERTDNGLTLLLHDVPGQYVISVRVVVPLTLADEPPGLEGVAAMTSRLLDEGTSRHTAEEFSALLERHGAIFGASVTDGGLMIDLDVPGRSLRPALELLTDALSDPVFPPNEVERILATRLAEIEQERSSAPARAGREFVRTLYAAGERAGVPLSGSAETIAAITRDDIVEFHRLRVGPTGATVTLAGDLTGLDARADLAATVGRWQAPTHRPAAEPELPRVAADAARLVVVDRPGSVQSELMVGCPGPSRGEGSWAPYPVLGFVVGGAPNARLDQVLREEKGYTYGIRAAFRPRVVGGRFVVSGAVRADVTADALRILLELLGQVGEGFTDEEVRAGTDYVSLTAPARYATADAIADETAALALERLPADFTTRNLAEVRELTAGSLADAWRSVVTGAWTIVVVGDADAIVGPLREAGFDPAVVPN